MTLLCVTSLIISAVFDELIFNEWRRNTDKNMIYHTQRACSWKPQSPSSCTRQNPDTCQAFLWWTADRCHLKPHKQTLRKTFCMLLLIISQQIHAKKYHCQHCELCQRVARLFTFKRKRQIESGSRKQSHTSCCSSRNNLQQNITGVQRVRGHERFHQLERKKMHSLTQHALSHISTRI